MRRMRQLGFVPCAVVALVALGAPAARAASISIDDANPNETITFSGSGFINFLEGSPRFFTVNGQNYNGGGFSVPGISEASPVTFSGLYYQNNQNHTSGTRTLYLVEDLYSGAISDILTVTWARQGAFNGSGEVTTVSGSFRSDDENHNLGYLTGNENPLDVFLEGGPVNFAVPDLSFTVESDAPPAVPEPASLVLLGTGMAAVAWRHRKARA